MIDSRFKTLRNDHVVSRRYTTLTLSIMALEAKLAWLETPVPLFVHVRFVGHGVDAKQKKDGIATMLVLFKQQVQADLDCETSLYTTRPPNPFFSFQ